MRTGSDLALTFAAKDQTEWQAVVHFALWPKVDVSE
jgi:hypothetical protein